MSAITTIGSWRVRRHQRGWITADGRCVFCACDDSWRIINVDKNDCEALMEHGLIDIATGYSLRESAALVANITSVS